MTPDGRRTSSRVPLPASRRLPGEDSDSGGNDSDLAWLDSDSGSDHDHDAGYDSDDSEFVGGGGARARPKPRPPKRGKQLGGQVRPRASEVSTARSGELFMKLPLTLLKHLAGFVRNPRALGAFGLTRHSFLAGVKALPVWHGNLLDPENNLDQVRPPSVGFKLARPLCFCFASSFIAFLSETVKPRHR